MKKLKISETLTLPIDFVTSTQAILAQKGRGKTYTAQVEAEELLEAGQQVVIVDPTDAWWGLRSSPDGRSTGYAIPVFGGDHADVPLDPGAGAELADAIATDHFSVILCTENMTKGEELRFGAAFFERLFRKNREALHLFVDEADVWAPQKPFSPDEAKALGALDSVVRRGRKKGLGCTLITQRAAVLNKNVLSQIDQLVCLGMHDPRDLAAVGDWVKGHDKDGRGKEMLVSLPDLPQGDAWVWNPRAALFARITIRRKHTFDSGATPKAGEKAKTAKVLSPVDVQRLGAKIAAAAERAKAEDPKHLREIARRLTDELAKANAALAKAERAPAVAPTRTKEVPVLGDAQLARAEQLIAKAERLVELEAKRHTPLREALGNVTGAAKEIAAAIAAIKQPSLPLAPTNRDRGELPPGWTVGHTVAPAITIAHNGYDPAKGRAVKDPTLEKPSRAGTAMRTKMLAALAEEDVRGLTRHEIRVYTGYADSGPTSQGFAKLLGENLATMVGDRLVITPAGINRLGVDYQPLPRGRALYQHLIEGTRLTLAEKKILTALVTARLENQPTLTRAEIRERTGYADSGPTSSAMSRLCTFGYVVAEGRAGLRAANRFFVGGS